jgi:hypothetical protein
MPRVLDHVAWDACLVEPHPDKGLEAYARRKTGMPAPSIRYFAPVPWLARALVDSHPDQRCEAENTCRAATASVRITERRDSAACYCG